MPLFFISVKYFFGYILIIFINKRIIIYIHCVKRNKIIALSGILFRIKSAKNIIPARLKKVINKLNLSQKYFL